MLLESFPLPLNVPQNLPGAGDLTGDVTQHKKKTIDAASCRCGRGEKRFFEEDALLLGFQFFCHCSEIIAPSATTIGLLSPQNCVSR